MRAIANFSVRKIIILALNLASTLLTLLTGLRENPLLVLVTGRYDDIRSRLLDGSINYVHASSDLIDFNSTLDLKEVGRTYRFFSQPVRSPSNYLVDRSTCLRMDSMNLTRLNVLYDDFWGKGPRRSQIYSWSMSAPNCEVINFLPAWVTDECIGVIGGGNESACYEHIFDNFDDLKLQRRVKTNVEVDFGAKGAPFIKCRGRPDRKFNLIVDMLIQQIYWAGGSWHLEVQSSDCIAQPLFRDQQELYGLFSLQSADDKATVYCAAKSSGWLATIISIVYAIVSVSLIVHGVFTMIVRNVDAYYIPNAVRFKGTQLVSLLRYVLPSMTVARFLPANDDTAGGLSTATSGIRFKGTLFMASDVWMNHWLYIALSMLDAIANIRMTYVIFQVGTLMLMKRGSVATFLFLCSALGRITWLLCLAHSITRWVFKLMIHSARAFGLIRNPTRERLDWYIDGSAMFVSYKLYSIELLIFMYLMLKINMSTTFMVRVGKVGVYGGALKVAQFWKSEVVCDYTIFFTILISTTYVAMFALLRFTRYKHVVNNSAMKMLQARYVLVGWDAMVAMDALGIDPLKYTKREGDGGNTGDIMNAVAPTSCSLGAFLQQLYTSGPSGLVHLAGDFIFMEGGFSREHPPCKFSVKRAMTIGLITKNEKGVGASNSASNKYVASSKHTNQSVEPDATSSASLRHRQGDGEGENANIKSFKKSSISLFERRLKVHGDGLFGTIMLVDEDNEPGHLERSSSGIVEFVVQDALTLTTILDIKPLLGKQKKLRIF